MAVLAVWTLLLLTPAPAPAAMPASVPAASVLSAPGVVVKLGTASLEEYTQGDPASRVRLERGN